MSRRTFGNLRKTEAGRWQARYTGPDGQPQFGPHTFVTKAEANRFLNEMERDQNRGTWTDPRTQTVTLSAYADDWLPQRPLAPRTRDLYSDLLRMHILPQLGSFPVSKITRAAVRSWRMDRLEKTGATRVRQAYSLLRAIMNTAKGDGLILDNPCQITGAGQVKAPERPLLSVMQVYQLADAIEPSMRPMLLLTYFAHLRLGELLGLQRRDVHLEAATLRVERQLVRVTGRFSTGGSRLIETAPKTASRRTVDLAAPALEALRQHLAGSLSALPRAPLFVRPNGTRLLHHHVQVAWQRARAEVGLSGAHFHDLRHGGLTLAAQTGATLKEVMDRGGHSTPRAAMIYQHAAQSRGAETAAAMSALVEAAQRLSGR